LTILPSTNPSYLVFPTPLFPQIDPRTAKPGTEGMVLQLWKIEVADYTEEAVKSSAVKGNYGLVRYLCSLF
jgi:ribonuclease P/MRP protein subunit RPP1